MIPHSAPEDKSTVVVLTVKPAARGNLRGFADVRIGDIKIRDLRVIQQPGQRPWVSPPQKEWVRPDGTRGYSPLVEFSPALKAVIEALVIDAWRRGRGDHA